MRNITRFTRLAGFMLLAIVLIILLTPPDAIFSHDISFIYPSLSDPKANQSSVQTKMDFGDQEHVESFPMVIGEWRGQDYDPVESERMRTSLGADVMMMRDYEKPGLWRGLTFLIMQSKDRASFHPPQVCYPALGWEVNEEGIEEIPMSETFWEDIGDIGPIQHWRERFDPVKMSKLIVTYRTKENASDRHVVLYCYVRDNTRWGGSNTVTMLRVSGPTMPSGSYDDMLQIEKEFMATIMPLLFEPRETQDQTIVQIANWGASGVLLLISAFGLPIVIIFYPEIRRLGVGGQGSGEWGKLKADSRLLKAGKSR